MDEKNQEGKYSLAIGAIEDFSGENISQFYQKHGLTQNYL